MDKRTHRRLIALYSVAGFALAPLITASNPDTPPDIDPMAALRPVLNVTTPPLVLPAEVGNIKGALAWLDANGPPNLNTSRITGDEEMDIPLDSPAVTGIPAAAPVASPPPAVASPPAEPAPISSAPPPVAAVPPVEVPAPAQPSAATIPQPPAAPSSSSPVVVSPEAIDPESTPGQRKLHALHDEARRLAAFAQAPAHIVPDHYKGLTLRGMVDAYSPDDLGAILGILAATASL